MGTASVYSDGIVDGDGLGNRDGISSSDDGDGFSSDDGDRFSSDDGDGFSSDDGDGSRNGNGYLPSPSPISVVFDLGTRVRVRMHTELENGVLHNGQQPRVL